MAQAFRGLADGLGQSIAALAEHGYKFERVIGASGRSCICLVRSSKFQKSFVARRIPVTVYNRKFGANCRSETECLMALNHPNIVGLYETWTTRGDRYLILEYCPGGSLWDFIARNGCFPWTRLLMVCLDIVCAIEYCHSRGVAHLNIKPANIFIDRRGHACLVGFGVSAMPGDCAAALVHTAPEILTGAPADPFCADIWALGVTFYELASGHGPWDGWEPEALRRQIAAGPPNLPRDWSDRFASLVIRMMDVDPRARITASAILAGVYLKPGPVLLDPLALAGRRLSLARPVLAGEAAEDRGQGAVLTLRPAVRIKQKPFSMTRPKLTP